MTGTSRGIGGRRRKNPKVEKAETLSSKEVRVTFSEPVLLPIENAANAFTIERMTIPRRFYPC